MAKDEQSVVVVEWQGKAVGSTEKAAADAALRAMHTFPIERRLDPTELPKVQTMAATAIGRDDFETEEEWKDFLRYLGLRNIPEGFRISLSPAGDERLVGDDDIERVEIECTVEYRSEA